MFWTDRVNRLTGVLLLVTILVSVVSVFLSFTGDANPFDRGEVEEFITDVNDNESTLIASLVFDISSTILGLLVASALYLAFRGRNRVLALFTFAGLLASSAARMGANAGDETLIILADDFHAGGAGGIAAGDAVVLEIARTVAIFTSVLDTIGSTALGLGLLSLGALIAWAPQGGGADPPRWIGWVAAVSGLAFIFVWLGVLAEPFFALFGLAGITYLVAWVSLGIWLIRQSDSAEPAAMPAGSM